MRPLNLIIADNVKKYREELNLTQYKLTRLLGNIDSRYIYKIERGKLNLTIDELGKLAKALNVEVIDMVEDWSDYEINDAIKEADENEMWG